MNYNGRELTEGEFTVEYWGNTEIRRVVRIPRNFSLKFRGDLYNYAMLRNSEKVKIYSNWPTDIVELLKDQYGRLWLHVYYSYSFSDRIEEVFDFMEHETDADNRYEKNGGGPHYSGNLPHFFASENYDFILHEEANDKGDVEKEKMELLTLNKDVLSEMINEKIYYEVWARDTFDGETFLVKRYECKEEAEKALADSRQRALSQMESVRDTFWIAETTMDEIKEQEQRKQERRERIYKQWFYDDDRLRNYVILLVERLMEVVEMDKRRLIKDRRTFFQENNLHEEDCYIYVALEYNKGERGNSVGTKIKFRDGGSSAHTCVLINVHEITPSEDLYTKLIKIFETAIRDEMLDCF